MEIRQEFKEFFSRHRLAPLMLSFVAKWSALARLGNTQLMKLTIIAPFVGGLILFNRELVSLIGYSDILLKSIGVGVTDDAITNYSMRSLYYLYFGLFFLGIGSIIFSGLCPKDIAEHPSVDRYVQAHTALNSPTVCLDYFEDILREFRFSDELGKYYQDSFFDYLKNKESVHNLSYSLLHRMYREWDWGSDEGSETEAPSHVSPKTGDDEQDDYTFGLNEEYIFGSGYINIGGLVNDLINSPRIIWNFTIPFKDMSFKFQGDVYYLKYNISNESNIFGRLICSVFYGLGFVTLFIPSLETFLRIIASNL